MEFQEQENDGTHDNLDGDFKSSFPLAGIAIPIFNNGANGIPCPFSGETQDAEGEPGRHNLAVKGTVRDESMRSRD
jgi:hypothetical protein